MKYFHVVLLCVFILPLLSCQTFDTFVQDVQDVSAGDITAVHPITPGNEAEKLLASPCPEVSLVDDLSSISDFTNPIKPKPDDLISRVDLHSAQSTCKLSANTAIVDLKLIFNG